MICNLIRSLEVISQRGSQLRRWSFNLRSGTRVLAGGFAAAKHLAKFRKWISFRSYEMGFRLRNFRSTLRDCLQTAITSLFQLQFVHRLKRWTFDFPSFEKNIVCIKWTLVSTWNVSNNCCPLEFLHVRFLSLLLLLAFMICFWQRNTKLQILDSYCKWASIFFAMDYTKIFLILGLLWW